jgi:hypothetical protein
MRAQFRHRAQHDLRCHPGELHRHHPGLGPHRGKPRWEPGVGECEPGANHDGRGCEPCDPWFAANPLRSHGKSANCEPYFETGARPVRRARPRHKERYQKEPCFLRLTEPSVALSSLAVRSVLRSVQGFCGFPPTDRFRSNTRDYAHPRRDPSAQARWEPVPHPIRWPAGTASPSSDRVRDVSFTRQHDILAHEHLLLRSQRVA